MRVFIALCIAVAFTSPASAYTGLDLLRDCANYEKLVKADPKSFPKPDELMAFGRCTGYLQGVMDTNQLVVGFKGKQNAFFCNPATGLQTEQLILIVTKHLKANPDKLHESARINVIVALRQAFPC